MTKRGGGFELGIQARLDFSMTPKSIKWFYPVWMALAIALLIVPAPAEATEALIFIHTDVAGSPVAATDIDGNIVWREGYRPYGERTKNESAAAGNRQFFHGKAFDADTGLSYFGARYYDPVVGRFMGVDAVGFREENLHSFNRYAYGNNNPYKFVDPDGNSPLSVFLVEVAKLTGIGYGLGVAADAISQAAAFGQVNWSIAASSDAAIAGGATGLLSGLNIGAAKTLSQIERSASTAATAQREGKITARVADKFSREPRSVMDKMVLDAAKEGKGTKIIENLGDPKFKGMEKWQYTETSTAGKTSTVHYVRDPKTGSLTDFKFTKHAE